MLNRIMRALGLSRPEPVIPPATAEEMAAAVQEARDRREGPGRRVDDKIAHLDRLMVERRASKPAAPRATAAPSRVTTVNRDDVTAMGPLHPLHPLNTMAVASAHSYEDNTCRTAPSDYSQSSSSSSSFDSCDSGSSYDSGSSSSGGGSD